MKKLLAIALLIYSTSTLHAQSTITQPPPSNGKFTGGIMINPFVAWSNANVDDPTKNNVTSSGAQFGFAYGLLGEYFFNNNYGISLNPRVSGYNSDFNYFPDIKNFPNSSVDRNISLQYVEVPVCLKMRTNEVGYMKYFAQVGIMPGVKLAAKANIDTLSGSTVVGSVKGLNVTNDVNLFMLAFVIGIGAEYSLGGTTAIVASITWNNGFTNVWGKHADNLNSNPPVLSNFNSPPSNISLNVGIKF